MSHSAPSRRAGLASALWPLPVLLVGFVIYGWVALHGYTISGFSDPMDYLFMADFYRAALAGNPAPEDWLHYRTTRFPPLFPMLLGAFGAGAGNVHLGVVLSNVTAVAAAFFVGWWARVSIASNWASALVALALLSYPAYFLLNLFPVSEPLAIMMMVSVFALLEVPRITTARLLVVGLIIGLSPLARTALLPLLPAFAIWLLLRRPVPARHMVLPLVLAALPWLVWTLYRRDLGADSYLASLTLDRIVQNLGGWPEAIWLSPGRLFAAMVKNWADTAAPLAIFTSVLLASMAAIGCLLRIRRHKIDGWFLAGYIAMILIWPYPHELGRFLVQVYPCLLICAITCATEVDLVWARRSAKSLPWRPAATALVVAIATTTLPTASKFVHRATLPVDDEMLGDKREPFYFLAPTDEGALQAAEVSTRIRLLARAIPEHLPPGECVYATMPHLLQLYGGTRSLVYPLNLDSKEVARDTLTACNYYFLLGMGVHQLGLRPNYPVAYLEGWVEPILVSEINLPDRNISAAALVRRIQPYQNVDQPVTEAPTN